MSFEVRGRPRPALVRGTGACALLAVLLAVLLPLAPVLVNSPTVRWPVDPSRPVSTMLNLTAYRPVELDARFSCRAARAAAEAEPAATLLSTVNPALPEVTDLGLVVRVSAGPGGASGDGALSDRTVSDRTVSDQTAGRDVRLTVDAVGTRLRSEPLPAGDCGYRVHGDPRAGLVISRDGLTLGRGPAGVLPDVDLLATSLPVLPGATTADLGVTLRLDDEFASAPTTLKTVLTVLLVLALLGVGVGLWILDRGAPRVPQRWRAPRVHLADAAVVLALLGWTLLAPSTDDDGYYAAMAANSRLTGYVGNYYQLYDQSFTPITWFYQVLAWWQSLAGTAPVAQRVLALTAGLLTWCAVRAYVSSALRHGRQFSGRLVERLTPAVAGVAFLAWWLPQDMGVRPEGVVALLAVCALLGVRVAVRRRRLVAAFGASAAAGLALATHTTGFVGLAPLLAGLGGLWTLVAVPGRWLDTSARALAVISGGTTAALAGFADGSLRDFLRAERIFLDIQPQEHWYSEYIRWFFLLSDSAMGNYAKRVAVLVTLVALVWFLVLGAAGRARGEPLPGTLRLAGWSLVASFGLLWFTPSKWTHHFGALAGVGPVFVTLLLVTVVPMTRRVFVGARLPVATLIAAGGSVLVALTLAGHGRNAWPYAWLAGFADVNKPPDVGPFTFGSPLCWLVVLAGCVGLGWLWTRWRADAEDTDRWGPPVLRGVALLVVVGLALNLFYLLGSFTLAAHNTANGSWSLWHADTSDPTASRCGAADAVSVYDPFTARPLTEVLGIDPDPVVPATPADGEPTGADATDGEPTDGDTAHPTGPRRAGARQRTGFEQAGGYYVGYQPPVQLGTGAATTVWGSLVASGGRTPDRTTGEMRTPWYRLPAGLSADQELAVLIAGSPNGGNSLTAEYGVIHGDRIVRLDPGNGQSSDLDDRARDPRWRSARLTPPPGARVVRLHAVDNSAGAGGWLAFGAPVVQHLGPLRTLLAARVGRDRPVALAWQIAFQYPCLRQPRVQNGITEPPAAAVLWADQPFAGTRDNTWQSFRGGLYGQVPRSQSVLQLTARVRGMPTEHRVEVLILDTPLPSNAYLLSTRARPTSGWSSPVPTPTQTLNELERCVQHAAATQRPAEAALCVPKPGVPKPVS